MVLHRETIQKNADRQAQEAARLDALRRYGILDTPPDPLLDDLTRLAAQICGTPVAIIGLMDQDRQWFKSKVGVEVAELPREGSFCTHTIWEEDALVVPDAGRDPRFADSPAVTGEHQVRFYAGMPLRTRDGHALGTLFVADRQPRQLQAEQIEGLRALARQAASQFEQRHTESSLRKIEQRFHEFMNNGPAMSYIKDEYGRFVYINEPLARRFDKPVSEWLGRTDAEIFSLETAKNVQEHDLSVFNAEHGFVVEEIVPTPDGKSRYWLSYKFLLRDDAGQKQLGGLSFDITERKEAEQTRERLVGELREALAQVKTLSGFLPICASCKNIRDDAGYWKQIESYLCEHSELEFTHGICPACLEKLYPEFAAAQRDGKTEPRGG